MGLLSCVLHREVHSCGEASFRGDALGGAKACPPVGKAGGCRPPGEAGFGSLPNHLLEQVFHHLRDSDRRTQFSICGVSRSWRNAGHHIFFSSPWEGNCIVHPSQVFVLSPRPVGGSRTGLVKCFLRREPGPGGKRFKFSLYMGADHTQPQHASFLLCAIQVSRSATDIYLNRNGRGAPAGRLAARNLLRTSYGWGLAPGVRLLGDAYCDRGYRQVKVAPQELGCLEFKAKIEGFMQPRRVEVRLPAPGQLLFGHALPTLCREGGDLEQSFHGGPAFLSRSSYFPPIHPALRKIANGGNGGSSGSLAACAGHNGSAACDDKQSSTTGVSNNIAAGAAVGAESAAGRRGSARTVAPAPSQLPLGALEGPLVLKNKPPEWNPEARCWCLNFRGRVKMASVKNFQLIQAADPKQRTVLLFGKVESDTFAMDFDPTVVTAFQSLAISLSTFGNKFLL